MIAERTQAPAIILLRQTAKGWEKLVPMNTVTRIILFATIVPLNAAAATATVKQVSCFVAANGNDANPGTETKQMRGGNLRGHAGTVIGLGRR